MLNQTITPEQALRILTINGAYGTCQENVKGSIKPGKLADLVVLSDNPLQILETDLKNLEVLMTMINGELVYVKPDASDTITVFSGSSMIDTITGTTPILPVLLLGVLLIGLMRTKKR